jgi:hypothetical protein
VGAKNIKADGTKKEIILISRNPQTDQTIFLENRPRTNLILMSKSWNESSFVRPSIDVRAALVEAGNVRYGTAADCHASKELNGEKTNDLVFSGLEKQEQDVSSSKNVEAVFWRRSNGTVQEKYADFVKVGIYNDPKSITAILEFLLPPTKDEVTCVKVSFYEYIARTHTSK